MNLYHKRFLSSRSAENIVDLFTRYKGAAKEITESWAMLEAAKRFCPNLNGSVVVVVGDGCSPRTGVLFAYLTKAEVHSIDPRFNLDHWTEHVEKQTKIGLPPQRLNLIKAPAKGIWIICAGKPVVVVWTHSHAPMNDGPVPINAGPRIDIAMPCCEPIPQEWMRRAHIVYEDEHVASPKRTIHVWGVLP